MINKGTYDKTTFNSPKRFIEKTVDIEVFIDLDKLQNE